MDLFDEIRQKDDEYLSVPGGIDLNDHHDMFDAVFCKVGITVFQCHFVMTRAHLCR